MATEIEAKLKVDSFDRVRSVLVKLGAKSCGQVLQRDYYFDNDQSAMAGGDKALRLRHEKGGASEKKVLSFKGPKLGGVFKRRQEVQLNIDDTSAAIELLAGLGFSQSLVIEKRREYFEIDNCEVSLDELPLLGRFVEIEGPDERVIESVQKKLALEQGEHVKKGYACLMREYCSGHGISQKEIVFA